MRFFQKSLGVFFFGLSAAFCAPIAAEMSADTSRTGSDIAGEQADFEKSGKPEVGSEAVDAGNVMMETARMTLETGTLEREKPENIFPPAKSKKAQKSNHKKDMKGSQAQVAEKAAKNEKNKKKEQEKKQKEKGNEQDVRNFKSELDVTTLKGNMREALKIYPEFSKIVREEIQLEKRSRELARLIKQEKNPKKKNAMEAELRKIIYEHFDVRQARRLYELKIFEERIQELRQQTERRNEKKDRIVEKRFIDLIGTDEDLRF
ncbi:MAG: hypothetical protein IJF17_06800 [Thermoguttaceae bacterium]|nr:hypothetical protein [Thermoguttaceae bacterium]